VCIFWYRYTGPRVENFAKINVRGSAVEEIYSITGHKPGDVQAILTMHYLPRDAEVAGNAIVKLNRYKAREDQKEDEKLPTDLPTALKYRCFPPFCVRFPVARNVGLLRVDVESSVLSKH
jgi:hypothetical protein